MVGHLEHIAVIVFPRVLLLSSGEPGPVLFFVMGMFFSPYLAGLALAFVIVRKVLEWCRKGKRTIQLTHCGRYCCPLSDADLARDVVLDDLGPVRPVSVQVGPAVAHSTMNDSVLDQTTASIGFWVYARGWLNPFFQYSPLGARNTVDVWYVLVNPVNNVQQHQRALIYSDLSLHDSHEEVLRLLCV